MSHSFSRSRELVGSTMKMPVPRIRLPLATTSHQKHSFFWMKQSVTDSVNNRRQHGHEGEIGSSSRLFRAASIARHAIYFLQVRNPSCHILRRFSSSGHHDTPLDESGIQTVHWCHAGQHGNSGAVLKVRSHLYGMTLTDCVTLAFKRSLSHVACISCMMMRLS